MCTCINVIGKKGIFGRNLDLSYSFKEKVIITPQNYQIKFKHEKEINKHFAFVGIGTVIDNYPLYAEASNEYGLSIANLNFSKLAKYNNYKDGKVNLAIYELPLYVLAKYKSVKEVKEDINSLNLINESFNENVNLTDLHVMIADKNESIVIEQTKEGLKVFENKYHILTNNPFFDYHEYNLANYAYLFNKKNNIYEDLNFKEYSLGLSSFNLPGDGSSSSRFVRGYFNKTKIKFTENEDENVVLFFKLLDSVSILKGCIKTLNGYHYTKYSSCFSYNSKKFYYKRYLSNCIYQIDMFNQDLSQKKLIEIDMKEDIEFLE